MHQMESMQTIVLRQLRAAWRRRWFGVLAAWVVCCAGWFVVISIPNEFESSARLFVDADAVLTPLLKGLAAESSPATQLELLQRTLLSRPNLEKLVSKTDLDLTVNSQLERERLLAHLALNIKVVSQTRNLFTITYRSRDPRLSRDVVQTLLTIFVESATGTSRSDMDNARNFLVRQIHSYEDQLRAAEKRRAEFRAKYIDVLPNESAPNTSALEAARSTVQQLEGRMQDAQIVRDALRQEVASTPPQLSVESGGLAGPAGKSKLQEAEDQLRVLLLKDTDQHPDVITQRKLIESLHSSPSQPAVGKGASGFKRSVPNPVYDQLRIKLIDAETDLASLRRQRDEAAKFREELEKTQREQPGLIAEYQNMDRDYNVLRHNYEELLNRLQEANIAEAADTQADKVKLQIIDPPQISRLPVAPNRMLLVTAVLIAGLGCGIGVPVLLAQTDHSFSTPNDLRSLGLPVVGGISMLSMRSFQMRAAIVLRFGTAVVTLMVVYGGLMAHLLHAAALI